MHLQAAFDLLPSSAFDNWWTPATTVHRTRTVSKTCKQDFSWVRIMQVYMHSAADNGRTCYGRLCSCNTCALEATIQGWLLPQGFTGTGTCPVVLCHAPFVALCLQTGQHYKSGLAATPMCSNPEICSCSEWVVTWVSYIANHTGLFDTYSQVDDKSAEPPFTFLVSCPVYSAKATCRCLSYVTYGESTCSLK